MLTQTFESQETWAKNLARLWVERLHSQPNMRICLAAGNTPVPVCDFDEDAVKFHVQATQAIRDVLYSEAAENTQKL